MLRDLRDRLRRKVRSGDKPDESQPGSSEADPSRCLFEEYHDAWHEATGGMYHGTTTSSPPPYRDPVPRIVISAERAPSPRGSTSTECEASTYRPSTDRPPTKRSPTMRAPTKRAPTKRSSTDRPSTDRSSTDRSSTERTRASRRNGYAEPVSYWHTIVVPADRPVYLPINRGR